ncbi:hypothetical protein EYF80_011305 [Liparis tanakae]|uniref:CMRF35-like molecule 1 n=1 Tax=Liparis tanakae TaxID=230148 RepID=A0A4Z2IMT0_9TELE|nr:hypothetical protein EYF80_011305 [Liparis tanakae]
MLSFYLIIVLFWVITTLTATSSTLSPTPEPVKLTSVFAEITPTAAQGGQHRVSLDLKQILIPLGVLIITVLVTLFIWFMLRRHKQTKSASSAMAAEEEVTYSHVDHTRNTSNQRSNPERDADVTYSSVVTIRQKSIQRVEAKDENVTYSTLA